MKMVHYGICRKIEVGQIRCNDMKLEDIINVLRSLNKISKLI